MRRALRLAVAGLDEASKGILPGFSLLAFFIAPREIAMLWLAALTGFIVIVLAAILVATDGGRYDLDQLPPSNGHVYAVECHSCKSSFIADPVRGCLTEPPTDPPRPCPWCGGLTTLRDIGEPYGA